MSDLWVALWLFLPAGVANASPVIANKIPLLNRWRTRLDFGTTWRGQPVFGTNKTWRGLSFATCIAAGVALLQHHFVHTSVFGNHSLWFVAGYGALLGAGALLGDAIESFFKRQAGVKPGQSWFPFDQVDYIIGGLLASSLLVRFSLGQYGAVLVAYFGLHLVFTYIGYALKLKDKPI